MTARVTVHHIPPGSVVLLDNVLVPTDLRQWEQMLRTLRDAVGHNQFAVIATTGPGGNVEVLSEVDDFPAWLLDKLEDVRERRASVRSHAAIPPLPTLRMKTSAVRKPIEVKGD